MNYLIDGEIIDAYGGNYTYRDLWYEIEDGEYIFFEHTYGEKGEGIRTITDNQEIEEIRKEFNL